MSDEVSPEEREQIELYLDGLIQNGVVEDKGNDKLKISQEFYDAGINRLPYVYSQYPEETKFSKFNMAFILELMERMNITNDQEIEEYSKIMIRCFIASGIFQKLFPDTWEAELSE